MTSDEAVVAISVACPGLTQDDVRGFLACKDDERELLIRSYRDAGIVPSADAWTTVLNILRDCSELAGLVIPIMNVVSLVFAL